MVFIPGRAMAHTTLTSGVLVSRKGVETPGGTTGFCQISQGKKVLSWIMLSKILTL